MDIRVQFIYLLINFLGQLNLMGEVGGNGVQYVVLLLSHD